MTNKPGINAQSFKFKLDKDWYNKLDNIEFYYVGRVRKVKANWWRKLLVRFKLLKITGYNTYHE